MNPKLSFNFRWLDKEKNLLLLDGFIWIALISGLIIYYQLIPDINSSIIAGIITSVLTYSAIFGIKLLIHNLKARKTNEV